MFSWVDTYGIMTFNNSFMIKYNFAMFPKSYFSEIGNGFRSVRLAQLNKQTNYFEYAKYLSLSAVRSYLALRLRNVTE